MDKKVKPINRRLLKASGIFALVLAASLLVCGIFELIVLGMRNSLDVQGAGKRWSAGGDRYAVCAMYAEEDAGIVPDMAEGWVRGIDSALLEASVTPPENGRSWAWCYGTDDVLTVTGPKGSSSAETLVAAGDFFVFHQLKFRYGGGFLNDPSIPMGVVLDLDLAWRVFGAQDVVGMTVTIGGEEFTVVGVAEQEKTSGPYRRAYGTAPRMYMSYPGYAKVGSKNVTLFEAVLPNSVKGFAMNIFTGAVKANEDASRTFEATERFSLANRFENMKELSYAWVSVNKIEYPYWENEARVMDYRAAVMMLFEVFFAAAAGLSLLVSFILLRVSGWTLFGTLCSLFQKLAKRREEKIKNRPPRENKKAGKKRSNHKKIRRGSQEKSEVTNDN